VLALRGATAEVREKLLRNLSSRAAEMINDDLAAMGPVKLSLVEAAQGEIAKQAQDLGSQGKITILSGSEKVV
jgi:flagellar motor switch protein FliG